MGFVWKVASLVLYSADPWDRGSLYYFWQFVWKVVDIKFTYSLSGYFSGDSPRYYHYIQIFGQDFSEISDKVHLV